MQAAGSRQWGEEVVQLCAVRSHLGQILIFTERGCQLHEAIWSGFSVHACEGELRCDT